MRVYTPRTFNKALSPSFKQGILSQTGSFSHLEQLRLLAKAAHEHPWTFATVDAVSRSVLGAGWKFVTVERYKNSATTRQRRVLEDFFDYTERQWDNIKDFQSLSDKVGQTINSYRLFGHSAWEIIKNGGGKPVGFDVLSGITVPNVKEDGTFKSPAFLFYAWGTNTPVEYDAEELAYFYNPGITGNVMGESPYESLVNTTLPSDIFAAVSYRSLFENVNAPYNGIWEIDPAVSDDDMDMFMGLLEDRYSGAANYGRNPLVIRGGAKFNPVTSRNSEDAPYLAGRKFNREEFYGVTGVDGNKLGISEDANKANMRETRREFHENTLRPLFQKLQSDIYSQIIVRVLGIRGWELRFNEPDITNKLEQASIDMRYLQWGVESPNEVREQKGLEPREDGDYYLTPANMQRSDKMDEDTASNDTSPNLDNTDTTEEPASNDTTNPVNNPNPAVRPDRETDGGATKSAVVELKKWRKRHLEYLDGKKAFKEFESDYIEPRLVSAITDGLKSAGHDFSKARYVFDRAIDICERMKNGT
jgi:HK97 family phage portal protein